MTLARDLSASLGFHMALFAVAVLWAPITQLPVFDEPLPIEIVTIDEFTRIIEKIPPKTEAPIPDPKVETPSAPAARTTPEAATDTVPLPEAKAAPEAEKPTPKETEKPREFTVANPVPLARPSPLQSPQEESALDLSQVRALLDKTPDAAPPEDSRPTYDDIETGDTLTISEIDALRAQMQKCWSPPAGARDAESLVVQVRLSLTRRGDISAGPVVINRSELGNPFFRAAAESVLRAIRQCEPFELPPEKYVGWRDIELTFDPSKMLGQ